MQECEAIKRQLPISSYSRPAWDVETLGKLGVADLSLNFGVSGRIYIEKMRFIIDIMFTLCARKE